jgi:hypothetical protein
MVKLACAVVGRRRTSSRTSKTGARVFYARRTAKALDVRDPQRFLQISSATDETTKRLKQELSDAYGRHQLSGHRIPIEPRTLVNEREVGSLSQQREVLKWRHEAGIDRWDHPRDLPPPPPPEPPGIGR